MLKPDLSTRDKRKAVFAKIGRALTDYHSGNPTQFRIHPKTLRDRFLSSNRGGPAMKTQQWERTSK